MTVNNVGRINNGLTVMGNEFDALPSQAIAAFDLVLNLTKQIVTKSSIKEACAGCRPHANSNFKKAQI